MSEVKYGELNVYWNREYNCRDREHNNHHIANERKKDMAEDQNALTNEDIELDIDEAYVPEIPKILKKHE